MPAIYAHLRFGEETAKTLPAPLIKTIEKYPEAFALGTQGPDILFYHQPMKKNDIRARGTFLHTLSGKTFFEQQKTPQTETNGALISYLCGFLCHFTLDTLCHKYIDEHSNAQVSHGKIESEFDKFLLKKDGLPIRGYNTATPILNRNGSAEACASVLNVPIEEIFLSVRTIKKINGWFSKKCEPFHFIAHAFLKIAGMERKFGDMFLHKKDDPLCVGTNEFLSERFHEAIPHANALIEEFFTKETLENELFRYNFSGIITMEE